MKNLNTSHVNVQLSNLKIDEAPNKDLNTSHVNVQSNRRWM